MQTDDDEARYAHIRCMVPVLVHSLTLLCPRRRQQPRDLRREQPPHVGVLAAPPCWLGRLCRDAGSLIISDCITIISSCTSIDWMMCMRSFLIANNTYPVNDELSLRRTLH